MFGPVVVFIALAGYCVWALIYNWWFEIDADLSHIRGALVFFLIMAAGSWYLAAELHWPWFGFPNRRAGI
ncbi:MAG TPA: hypothetical protein VFW28_06635 [Micropepsaceae bacterium]|nr:hypothetical protein [Micropepsaceae bacterium]